MGQNIQVLQGAPKVEVGDTVVINLEKDIVQMMQVGHGGWCSDMKTYLGKKGKVKEIDSDGDVKIKFQHGSYTYNPNVVAKVLSKGDIVQISSDIEKAKFLQNKHGGWNSRMNGILGKTAQVQHVFKTYDVSIRISGDNWCLNPLLCTVVGKSSSSSGSDDDDSDDDMFSQLFTRTAKMAMSQIFDIETTDIEKLLSVKSAFKWTELHLSILKNDEKLTKELLEKGADINETDEYGNTALHIAVIKNIPKMVQLLIKKGAKVDIFNKKKHTPIHLAVMESSKQCVKELLESSINIKDDDGDTPLALAIIKGDTHIIDLLLNHQNIDLSKTNNNGFSAFHMAALRDDPETVKKILQLKPAIVDIQKIDGFCALHLAALNDNLNVAKTLIEKGKAKLNIKTINGSTPLMLAAQQNHLSIVKLLVSEGADINAQDNDGDTALHAALDRKSRPSSILELFTSNSKKEEAIDIVVYLAENGASLTVRNENGKTPLDMIDDDSLKENLQKKVNKSQMLNKQRPCMLCSEVKFLVKFEPCGHLKLCTDCNKKNTQIKKCIECKAEITVRIEPERKEVKKEYSLKSLFKTGDQVRISMNEDLFNYQEAKDNPDMKKLLKKPGIVVNTMKNEKVHVKFEDEQCSFLPEMLTKVFACGEEVKLLEDIELLKSFQEDHGGWNEDMKKIIGKTGKVVQIETQHISVEFDTKIWCINPMACVSLKRPDLDISDDIKNTKCCVNCHETTDDVLQLQCGHVYCSKCKYLKKCNKC